jgi:hypothetical protein
LLRELALDDRRSTSSVSHSARDGLGGSAALAVAIVRSLDLRSRSIAPERINAGFECEKRRTESSGVISLRWRRPTRCSCTATPRVRVFPVPHGTVAIVIGISGKSLTANNVAQVRTAATPAAI